MKYLCDTCILVDYLRGDDDIRQILSRDRKDGLGMSIITHMELMVGAFNKQEVKTIKKAFHEAFYRQKITKTPNYWEKSKEE